MACKRTNIWSWDGLYCPSCQKHGVRISNVGVSIHVQKPYGSRCAYCPAQINLLGADGEIRTAVAEYKQICRRAIKLRKQQGEAAMSQQLELNVNAFLGVTDWMNPATNPPALSGWYDVRFKMTDEEREERQPLEGRRYWHADKQRFSWLVGADADDELTAQLREKLSTIAVECLEYRGSLEAPEYLKKIRAQESAAPEQPVLRQRPTK